MNPEKLHTRVILGLAGSIIGPGRVPHIPETFREILVVRQHDQLGDMMCVIPALRRLKETYPGSRITLIASPVNHEIMQRHPCIDRVLLYDKGVIRNSFAAVRKFYSQLRERPYDLAVVPSTVSVSLTSNLLARLSGAPIRIGPGVLSGTENPSKFLFTHPVHLDWSSSPGRHQALRNIDILRPLGIAGGDISYVLGIGSAEAQEASATLADFRSKYPLLLGMHPGAAKPGNMWPAENFVIASRKLYEMFGNGLVITIGPRDGDVDAILGKRIDVPHMFIRNTPIRKVAALINELDFFLSNDTGILHIAGALRPETLGLFGPTDPLHWAPAGRKNHYIASKDNRIGSIEVEEVCRVCEIILRQLKSAGRGQIDN